MIKGYQQIISFLSIFLLLTGCLKEKRNTIQTELSVVTIPDSTHRNDYYFGNRAPLQPSALIKLPVGAVKPKGWLLEYLHRQRDGMTGNLTNISAWLNKKDNAWLSKDGKGKWGWEEVPYWLKGYANMGYILEDQAIIDEAKIWLDGAINSQQPDGFFGPVMEKKTSLTDDGPEQQVKDFWGNMIMLYCLQSYYEYSGDQRVISLMTKYFKYELSIPDQLFLDKGHYWHYIRGGDNLHSVIWLYNRTGEKWLLELAEKIHRNTAPWGKRNNSLDDILGHKEKRPGTPWPEWFGDLIDWHNVNIAEGFREPAQYYLISGDRKDVEASYENFNIVRDHFGQVPGGMFGSDENTRPGYSDPHQGIELCGMVEQMNSDEHLLRITGDIFWADHDEDVAFNTYPAATMPDFRSLRYITSPNMVLNDSQDHSPGIDNSGPFLMMNPFSSRCCQHNHSQGWPYYCENMWMATPDNGLAAVLYAANSVRAMVGAGNKVMLTSKTNYPFEDTVRISITEGFPDTYPLYFRVPGWAKNTVVLLNGKSQDVEAREGKYVKILQKWEKGDQITLIFPRKLTITTWDHNHNSVSVNYGPLTFSLKIKEDYEKEESTKTAISDSKWQEGFDVKDWPSFEIHPGSAWNYGLVLQDNLSDSFEVIEKPWPDNNFPFTPQSTPITIKAHGKKIPGWTIDENGLAGELHDSPILSQEKTETMELIPMGAARLRISSFPVIGTGSGAQPW